MFTEDDLENEILFDKTCPRIPEPTPLEHPIPYLREALEQVSNTTQQHTNTQQRLALSVLVVLFHGC